MSELRLAAVKEGVRFGSCGVPAIDGLAENAYEKTLFKQVAAYHVVVDNVVVGGCMIRFVTIVDEEYCIDDSTYAAIEITYIAIEKKFQHHGFGRRALDILVQEAQRISRILPIRFLVLEALQDKKEWYETAGFREYPRKMDARYPHTVPMCMDFIDKEAVDQYVERVC